MRPVVRRQWINSNEMPNHRLTTASTYTPAGIEAAPATLGRGSVACPLIASLQQAA
jgi:hypothetical protein